MLTEEERVLLTEILVEHEDLLLERLDEIEREDGPEAAQEHEEYAAKVLVMIAKLRVMGLVNKG